MVCVLVASIQVSELYVHLEDLNQFKLTIIDLHCFLFTKNDYTETTNKQNQARIQSMRSRESLIRNTSQCVGKCIMGYIYMNWRADCQNELKKKTLFVKYSKYLTFSRLCSLNVIVCIYLLSPFTDCDIYI